MQHSEAFHLEKLKKGELDSFRWIIENYHRKVYQYCFHFVRNKEVVEEITSDVFVQLWNKRTSWQTGNAIGGLLCKIAKDYAIDYLRKAAREEKLRESFLQNYENSIKNPIEESIRFKEVLAMADRAIDRLPPKRRQVFRMRYQENLSNRQIAQILNLSPHTVRSHLAKAAKYVRAYLRTHSDIVFLLIAFFS